MSKKAESVDEVTKPVEAPAVAPEPNEADDTSALQAALDAATDKGLTDDDAAKVAQDAVGTTQPPSDAQVEPVADDQASIDDVPAAPVQAGAAGPLLESMVPEYATYSNVERGLALRVCNRALAAGDSVATAIGKGAAARDEWVHRGGNPNDF